MKFERFYTAQELDIGLGMVCHPCCGIPFDRLRRSGNRFYTSFHRGGWDDDPEQLWQDRISEGKDVEAEEPFPAHWKWDPYSGKKLESVQGKPIEQKLP